VDQTSEDHEECGEMIALERSDVVRQFDAAIRLFEKGPNPVEAFWRRRDTVPDRVGAALTSGCGRPVTILRTEKLASG
jgi:hypothetical protein